MKLGLLRGALILGCILMFWNGGVLGDGQVGEDAADFPPGLFSDGQNYQLSDLKGRVVVLFFFERTCPTCKKLIPERNQLVKQYQDKPVKFIAVGAGDTLQEVNAYARETGLVMPIFADSLSVMEKRYGQKISLNNIYQLRVVGPDGKISAYQATKETIDKALTDAKPKYPKSDYDAKLAAALDCFESGQYAQGAKVLTALRKSKTKAVSESADKLFSALKEEAKEWKAEAEKLAQGNPVAAYDLHARIASVVVNDDLGKAASADMKKLAATKQVKEELAARTAYFQMLTSMTRMTAAQKKQALAMCQGFIKKHPESATTKKLEDFVKDLSD